MSNGVDRRSQIDTETVKALLLVNGGGAVALLTLFGSVLGKNGYEALARAILVGVLIFMLGLVFAIVHNHLRRKCSLHYDVHKMRPPAGRLLWLQLHEPTICVVSIMFMWLTIITFFLAGMWIAIYGIITLWPKA
jgi:small-conductance mechanosensitive channel